VSNADGDADWEDASGGGSLPDISRHAGEHLVVRGDETGVEWQAAYGFYPAGPSPHGSHRYWRIVSMFQDNFSFVQIADLKFKGVPSGPNLATGGIPIESGHFRSNTAAQAFDGNPNTVWEGNATSGDSRAGNIWVGYDFGSAVSIVEVEVQVHPTYETDERPRAGWISYSDDGANWVPAWPFGTWSWASTLIHTSISPFYSAVLYNPASLVPSYDPIADEGKTLTIVSGVPTWV